MGVWVLCIVAIQVNYPSASSPTETLLRLLLSLNNQVESSFRLHTSPKTSMNYPICSSAGGVSKEQGRMSRSLWMPWGTSVSSKPYPKGFQWVTHSFGNTTRYLIVIEAQIYKWFVFFLYNCIDWQLVDWTIFVIPMQLQYVLRIIIIALELIHQRLKNLDQADYFFLCITFKMCFNDFFVSVTN